MSKWKKKDYKFSQGEQVPIPILGDGAMANVAFGDGKLFPLIIVDTSDRPDFDELIKYHQRCPTGDVNSS